MTQTMETVLSSIRPREGSSCARCRASCNAWLSTDAQKLWLKCDDCGWRVWFPTARARRRGVSLRALLGTPQA